MDSFGGTMFLCVVVAVIVVISISLMNKKQKESKVNTNSQPTTRNSSDEILPPQESVEVQKVSNESGIDLTSFAKTQLIGGNRFIESYKTDLHNLHMNPRFMEEMFVLRKKFNGREITDARNVNKEIADYFYKNNLNEKYPQVNSITQKVRNYGKQASAHISIYYAMFLFDWKHN